MWKLRRGYSLLSNNSLVIRLSTSISSSYAEGTQGSRSVADINPSVSARNHRSSFSYSRGIPSPYSTSSVSSNAVTVLTKPISVEVGHDSNHESIEDDDSSESDDEIESKPSGIRNANLDREVEVILKVLKGIGGKESPSESECSSRKMEVMSGADVTHKLNQCGLILTSELVVEVLSRTRNDWEVAFTFFLWVSKQPGYTLIVREYHSMISILSKRRKFDTAWSLIDEMRQRGIINPNTLLIMMRRYCAVHDVASAVNTFHAYKRFNFHLGVEEFHKLLSALTRYKNVQEAEHLLFSNKNIYPFNTKSFNIVLSGWCNAKGAKGMSREAYRFWRLMIDEGIKPDVVSYSSFISCCSKLNRLREVLKLFETMKEKNIDPDRKVYNAVIHALAKGGHAKEAFDLFGTMQEKGITPNAITFNSLIMPLCKSRKNEEVESVFGEMLSRGIRPTTRTLHAFLHMQRTAEEVFSLLDKMKNLGCHPNKDTYLLLIRTFCRWRQLHNVNKLWNEMSQKGWNDDESSYITLIHGLFLNGNLKAAHKIYLEMKQKSLLPDSKTDELMQTWLSNKQMAELPMATTPEN